MYKTSAQQIRRLELRIAKLEKEAGIFTQIKNIPKTIKNKIMLILTDAFSYLNLSWKKLNQAQSAIEEGLRLQLETRLRHSFDRSVFLDDREYVEVLSYNRDKPESSKIEYGSQEMEIRSLPKFLEDRGDSKLSLDVKGAYVSWHRDFSEIISYLKKGEVSPKKVGGWISSLKRHSKFLYRFIKIAFDLGLIVGSAKGFFSLFSITAPLNVLLNLVPGISSVYGVSLKEFIASRFIRYIQSSLERAVKKHTSSEEEFDQLAFGKQASRYPHTERFARQLEAHVY